MVYDAIPIDEHNNFMEGKMISVIVPSYNYGKFLYEALESLVTQTKIPDEIIIMDDCSTDGTDRLCEAVNRLMGDKIRYIRNEKNLGAIDNFDKGVKKSKGDYVCLLGADNRFTPTYIEKTSEILDKIPDIGIVYTYSNMFGPIADRDCQAMEKEINKGTTYYHLKYKDFEKGLIENENFIHGSAMYRKKAYDECGGYRANHTKGLPEDYTLWRTMIRNGWKAQQIKEYLLEYRHHSDNQRSKQEQD